MMGAYWSASQLEQLKAAFKAAGKKLDMGKCCVHFRSPDDLPLEAIGKLIAAISCEEWIEHYERSLLTMNKAKAAKAAAKKAGAAKGAAKAPKRAAPGRSTPGKKAAGAKKTAARPSAAARKKAATRR